METLCACSQMKNSKQKNVLDWGKEANESKEERKDPFLCRKENKSSLPELSVLWFVVVTCPCICCLYFSCRGLFLCLRLLCPFKCLSSIRQRDRNRVVMRRPGNPDQLSLTLAGPVVPSVCGFMGALGRYSPGVAEVVDESFRVRDGILEKWLGELEKKTHGKGWWTEKESCKEEVKKKSCRVNCTAGLTNWRATLAATSYCCFNFLVAVFSTFRKTDIFPFQQCSRLIHFVPSNIVMDTANQTYLQKKTLTDNHGLKGIKKAMCQKQPFRLIRFQLTKHKPCFESLDI